MAKKATKQNTGETPEPITPAAQINGNTADVVVVDDPEPTTAPTMTPEQIEEAVKKADFSIQEEPEKPTAVPPALMFDADTKVTPALIMQRMQEQEAQRKAAAQAAPEYKGPRVETRLNGRRIIRHN